MEQSGRRHGDLNTLLLFASVVDANGFAKAARRLDMPVSTLSRRIAEFEEQLGLRLLERSTRRLRLTEIGAEVFAHAQAAMEIRDSLEATASRHRSTVSGLLRLSAPPSIGDPVLTPLIGAFQAAYPAVVVQVFVTERFVDLFADGVDAALRIGRTAETSHAVSTLLTYRHQLVASPTYLRAHPAPHVPNDLLEHRVVAFAQRDPETTWAFVGRAGETQRVTIRPYFSMNDYAGIIPALLDGTGIGELPPIVRPDLLRSGQLVEIMPAWRFRPLALTLVHAADRYVPRHVRAFRDFCAETLPARFSELPQ